MNPRALEQWFFRICRIFTLVFFAAAVIACGSGNDGGGESGETTITSITSVGGTATSSDGKSSIEIPLNALTGEMPISITQTTDRPPANLGNVLTITYDFGPDDLTFRQAATINIQYLPADLPQNVQESNLRLAVESKGRWEILTNSLVDTTKLQVSAQVTHFSSFTIVAPTNMLAGALGFPLLSRGPYESAAPMTSVFDHSMAKRSESEMATYCPDGKVIAYNGNEGSNLDKGKGIDCKTNTSVKSYDDIEIVNGYPAEITLSNYSGSKLSYDGHPGYDYAVPCGSAVYAADQGEVLSIQGTKENPDDQGRLIIDHGAGYQTWYSHLSKYEKSSGEAVAQGALIGFSGNTGLGSDCHLHFEVRKDQIPLDPYGWIGSGTDPYQPQADRLENSLTLWPHSRQDDPNAQVAFSSETIPDGKQLSPGELFSKEWTVKITEINPANSSYFLKFLSGTLGLSSQLVLPEQGAGAQYTFSIPMQAPSQPGTYKEDWEIVNQKGEHLETLWVLIEVNQSDLPTTTLHPATADQPCFQCHQPQETSILPAPSKAPDVQSQFFKDREGNGNRGSSLSGSAMDLSLDLGLGHQPIFDDLPKEGVQLGSDNRELSFFGGPYQEPENNKDIAITTADSTHVQCIDCHNINRVTRNNRFQGVPGITLKSGIVSTTLLQVDETREAYPYEVCLRCHGNTFNNHVREALFTAFGTGLTVQARGNSPIDATKGVNAHGSNKRKEFDPDATPFYVENFMTVLENPPRLFGGSLTPDTNPPLINTAFHPVAAPGRNQSGVLNNFNLNVDNPSQQGQLMGGFGHDATFDTSGRISGQDSSGGLSRQATLHCSDCHNTDIFGTFIGGIPTFLGFGAGGFPAGINFPDYPGPITGDDTLGPGYRRSSDRSPSIPQTLLDDPTKAQGPHGSNYKRILRANYDTTVGTADTRPPGTVLGQYNPQNFALCFNCHNEAAFITPYWESASAIAPTARLTNFYRGGTGNVDGKGNPGGNLHLLHLVGRTNARCHECHNNVHSNVEAGNTIFVGMNDARFKADNPGHEMSSHLINFQPNITGNREAAKPMWGAGHMVNGPGSPNNDYGNLDDPANVGHKGPGCNLRCHGIKMDHNTDAHTVLGGAK